MTLPAQLRTIRRDRRVLYDLLFALEHFVPARQRLHRWRDAVRRDIAVELRRRGPGRVVEVDRVRDLPPERFRSHYLAQGLPVVLEKAAADWPCARTWSFESFRRRFGHETIRMAYYKGIEDQGVVYDEERAEEVGFAEFLDQAVSGGLKYARFSPILEKFPELLEEIDQRFLGEMPGPLSLGTTFEAFIGGAGTCTPIHNDPSPFFFLNVCGVKRWTLVPNHYLPLLDPPADGMSFNHSGGDLHRPDPERYPGLESVDWLEAVLEPGDLLFVPSWLWHHVRNEQATIGVRCGLMYPWSMLADAKALAFIRIFAAQDPPVAKVLYYTLFRSDLATRADMLLQPKMHWNPMVLERLKALPLLGGVLG